MLAQGLGNLGGGREMDESVARIVRAAAVDTLPFRLTPGRGRTDFVDLDHRLRSPVSSLSLLGFFVYCGSSKPRRDRKGRPCRTQELAAATCAKNGIPVVLRTVFLGCDRLDLDGQTGQSAEDTDS